MSFVATGTGRVGFIANGHKEAIAALDAINREMPTTKINILRDASTFFVLKAKEKVHVISGNLGRSIKVDNIIASGNQAAAGVSANMPYARAEEDREGRRRIPPHTTHPYMLPASKLTAAKMQDFIKKRFDETLRKHTTVTPLHA